MLELLCCWWCLSAQAGVHCDPLHVFSLAFWSVCASVQSLGGCILVGGAELGTPDLVEPTVPGCQEY